MTAPAPTDDKIRQRYVDEILKENARLVKRVSIMRREYWRDQLYGAVIGILIALALVAVFVLPYLEKCP